MSVHITFSSVDVVLHACTYTVGDGGNTNGEEMVRVEWNDHVSDFNTSWLRGEDIAHLPAGLIGQLSTQQWGAGFHPPEHKYVEGHHDANCAAWISDLLCYGVILIHGVPPNHDGMRGVMNTFGPLDQRLHPSYIFKLRVGYSAGELLDKGAYGKDALPVHTDGSDYELPPRCEAFLCQEYSALQGDTFSLVSDGLKVAEQFRKEYPEEYKLLSTTPLRVGRFRLSTEEECPQEDKRIYQRHSVYWSPIIVPDEDGHPKQIRLRHNKHLGLSLINQNQDSIKTYYRAYKLFHDKLNEPANLARFTLRPGMLLLFDNYRVCHGREKIFPSTTRSMLGAYVSDEVLQSRYKLMLTKQSRLDPKWVHGCSTPTVEALANRFLP